MRSTFIAVFVALVVSALVASGAGEVATFTVPLSTSLGGTGGKVPTVPVFDKKVTATTVTGTTQTTVYTKSIAGGTLGSSNCLRGMLRGHLTTGAIPGNATLVIDYGAGTFTALNAQALSVSTTNAAVTMDFDLTANNATNAQTLNVLYQDDTGTFVTTGNTFTFRGWAAFTTDETAAQTLDVKWTFSATGNTLVVDSFFLELLQ